MDGLLWLIIIMSFLVAVTLGVSVTREMEPYIPSQFSDPLMSRYAVGVLIFEPRIPLKIQFKALCSSIAACVAFGTATLLAFLKSDRGAFVVLLVFAGTCYASINAVRKYRGNRRKRDPTVAEIDR
jgi:hypothetical protein